MSRASVLAVLATSSLVAAPAVAQADDVQISGPAQIVVNQDYENLRWSIRGVTYSDDRYEWCSIELENTRTRRGAASDMPNEYEYSGTLEVDASSVDYAGGGGAYVLRADCYWAGVDEVPVTVRFASRTTLSQVTRERGRTTAVGTVKRFTGGYESWVGWKGARVVLERKKGATWVKVRTAKADAKGRVSVSATLAKGAKVRLAVADTPAIVGSTSTTR